MNLTAKHSRQGKLVWLLIVVPFILGACHTSSVVSKGSGADKQLIEEKARKSQQDQVLADRRLQEETSRATALEDENGHLKLLLLEKESQLKELEARRISLQVKLDETIQEVVRTKARLRSLESRAEAASNMAETEVALKMLKNQRSDLKRSPELSQAEQLIQMSTQEFRKENYGGALYLAGQAKDQIKLAQTRGTSGEGRQTQLLSGEIPFALPLDIYVKSTSNIREGPGIEYKVVATVVPGNLLKAYSYKDRWVRVEGENNLAGWIFQNLLSRD